MRRLSTKNDGNILSIPTSPKGGSKEDLHIKFYQQASFPLSHIPSEGPVIVPLITKGGRALVRKDVRQEIESTLRDIKIVGSGLCIAAIATGLVSFYDFSSGDHLYDLNTHGTYHFPCGALRRAIFMKLEKHEEDEDLSHSKTDEDLGVSL